MLCSRRTTKIKVIAHRSNEGKEAADADADATVAADLTYHLDSNSSPLYSTQGQKGF